MTDGFQPGPEFRRTADERSRQLRRRRRLIAGAAASAAIALGVAVPLVFVSGSSRSTTQTITPPTTAPNGRVTPTTTLAPSTTLRATSASVALPSSYSFNQISAANGGALLLSGSLSDTANTATPTCAVATVDAQTLRMLNPTQVGCDDPTAAGRTVGLVTRYVPGGQSGTDANVMLATVDPATGRVSQGPVVMTYSDCSDCRPVTAYGAGRLWVYDNSTTRGPELLEASVTTGRVVATLAMPKLFRPLLAANDDGLFIANSIEGGQAPGEAPPSAVYLVAPDARSPETVVADPALLACWLAADQTHLWIGMGSQSRGCTQETVWRLDGSNPRPVFETPTEGYVPPVVGDEAEGLWTVEWSTQNGGAALSTSTPQLLHIDPDTGRETITAIPPPIEVNSYLGGMAPGSGLLLNRYLYLLEPPIRTDGGYTTLVRVDLRTLIK